MDTINSIDRLASEAEQREWFDMDDNDEQEAISDQDIEGALVSLLEMETEESQCWDGIRLQCVETFADAELLTSDAGVVLHFSNGSAFQVTIRQSR